MEQLTVLLCNGTVQGLHRYGHTTKVCMGIFGRGGDIRMTQKLLNHSDIGTGFTGQGGKGMVGSNEGDKRRTDGSASRKSRKNLS